MSKKIRSLLIIIVFLSIFSIQSKSRELNINLDIKHKTLSNGLNVYLIKSKNIPAVTVGVYYKVGSIDERNNERGLSHYLEHMMFKTTKKLKAGEYSRIIRNNGGHDNAATSFDKTYYYSVLPKQALELALKLEADRMVNLTIDKKEFNSEKKVVLEELRNRYENDPRGFLFYNFMQFSYKTSNYGKPVIGTKKGVKALTPEVMKQYYKRFYSPNNAHLVIVGDIDNDKTLKLVKKYFGKLKRQRINRPIYIPEPIQTAERRIVYKKRTQLPMGIIYYHGPKALDEDSAAMEMIEFILFDGRSSRLYKKLVMQTGLAVGIYGGQWLQQHEAPFAIFFAARKKENLPLIEKIIYEEIERFKKGLIRVYDVEKAKNKFIARYIKSLQRMRNISDTIGNAAILGNYEFFTKIRPKRILNLKFADLVRVAKKYFKKSNRSVGYLLTK